MCDETRVRETAERELGFMQMMARVSAAFPRTIRTSGSYSVGFDRRPTDAADLLYWHQRFFEALDVSSLNRHVDRVCLIARPDSGEAPFSVRHDLLLAGRNAATGP